MTLIWPGPDDLTERVGACYTLAMGFVLANAPAYGNALTLVHGIYYPARAEGWQPREPGLPPPPPNPHAWVEVTAGDGVLVVDPVVRLAWSVEEHRRLHAAEVFRAYRADVALAVAERRGYLGPWDRRSLDAWEERRRLARADPRYGQAAALDRFRRAAGGPSHEA